MQPSFITDEYSQDLASAIRFAQVEDLHGVELRSLWGYESVAELPPDKLHDACSQLADVGLAVVVVDSFVFKAAYSTPRARAQEVAVAERVADAAVILGAPAVRIFAFWHEGAPDLPAVAEEVWRVAEVLSQRGLQVWVENGTFSTVGCGAALARLIALVNRPDVRALWDAGNVVNGGWPMGAQAGLQALAGHVAHVHVKNPRAGAPGSMTFGSLQGGLVDWAQQIATLRAQGFSGTLSLETHWRSNIVLRGRDIFDFPGGYAFSQGGETATTLMMHELKALLDAPQREAL